MRAYGEVLATYLRVCKGLRNGQAHGFCGAQRVEHGSRLCNANGKCAADMVVASSAYSRVQGQTGFACDVGKDGAEVCSGSAKWCKEIWRKTEFTEDVVCPLPPVEVKSKGARGERIVGGGYAR